MMSTGESLNPYNSTAAISEGQIDQSIYDDTNRYSYQTVVDAKDVRSVFRRGSMLRMCLVMMLFLIGVLLLGQRPSFMTGVILVLLPLLLACWMWFGRASLYLRRVPYAVGSIQGFVSEHRIVMERENSRSEYLLSALLDVHVRGPYLLLQFDIQRLVTAILPKRGFEPGQFDIAANLLRNRCSSNISVRHDVIDPRRTENQPAEATGPIPVDAVEFTGEVLGSDLKGTPLEPMLKRNWRILCGCGLFFVSLVPLTLLVLEQSALFVLPILVLLTLLVVNMIVRFRKLRNPDQCLYRARGWIDDEHICAQDAICRTVYQYDAFESGLITPSVMAFRLPGSLAMFVILSRSMFSSQAHWDQAADAASRGMPSIQRSSQ